MDNQIEYLIDSFNIGWTQGNLQDIATIMDENVVFVAPDLQTEIIGKTACLKTIEDYVNSATTLEFKVTDKQVYSWNGTAMIRMEYFIEYQMNNEHYKEFGKEFWTLNKLNDTWKLVWRVMVNNEKA